MVIDLDTNKYKVLGAKSGDKPRKPVIAEDSVASISTAKILYGISEGEISGIVGNAKGIYLEDTPLLDDNGNKNFENVVYDFRSGTVDQDYIKGFPDVSNELPISVELKSTSAWIKAINKTELSAVRIRLAWNGLKSQNLENGDVSGYRIDYAIDVKTDSGGYIEVLKTFINDKVSGKYERTHRIDLPEASTGWQIRVRRLTGNQNKENIVDKMYIESITEVIDVKLRYPNTALLGLQYDAKTFSRIAKISVRAKGKLISIPTNYDTNTGLYIGLWNGTFKEAYSNNPAWIFYDIVTASRYGLGKRIDKSMLDKWSIYSLGVYCDELIADGEGGLEKRFTCNVYLQSQQDAFKVLQQLSGIFRSLSYWNGEQIVLDADAPKDPVYTFSRANVVGGDFSYSGTRARDRHTVAKVAFDNPSEGFKTEYEYIKDEEGIAKFGINIVDISAIGCTSRAQAQRAGIWALKSEQLETRTVSFRTGLEGFIPQVGNIIEVSDELLAGRANGGRISSVAGNFKSVTLDRDLTIAIDDFIIINGKDGISQKRKVINVAGRIITVLTAFIEIEEGSVYAIRAADLDTMKFRVMTIKPDDNNIFSISAIQHEPLKYDAIDYGTDVKPTNITNRLPTTIAAPESVSLSSTYKVVQGQTVATLVIEWSQVKEAVSYAVEWRRNNGNWIKAPNTSNVSLEVTGVYEGDYIARVTAINAFDVSSNFTSSLLTNIKGKIGNPNPLTVVTAKGLLFGMSIAWGFGSGSEDANYTEIEVASAPDVNVALLGHFSYPTNNTEVTGLQGGLTLYYRGRLVDKLGNASVWSTWVSGTTSADAEKVLSLLEGQITESQLYADLNTKINQIDINKSAIANIDYTEINNSISVAQAKADEAKSSADANKIDLIAINQTVGANKISVDQSITTLVNKDTSLTNLYTALQSEYNSNKASVIQNITTLTDKDTSLSSLITNLSSDYNSNKATINNSLTTLSNADSALSSRITNTEAVANNAQARVGTVETSVATANSSIATLRTDLVASYAVKDTRTTVELPSYYYTNYPKQTIRELKTKSNFTGVVGTGTYIYLETTTKWSDASGGAIVQTAITDDNRVYIRNSVSATTWGAWLEQEDVEGSAAKIAAAKVILDARITSEKTVSANATSAVAGTVTTLQTTVNGHTSSISTQQTSINGLNAQYTVKVDVGGRVSGFGLASSTTQSDFAINADKFYIAPPTGNSKGTSPFMVLTTPTVINGVTVPTGTYMQSAYIHNGSIDIAKINKASITDLSALSANIGHFKSAATGARLEIKDSLLSVYDGNNNLRVRLGIW